MFDVLILFNFNINSDKTRKIIKIPEVATTNLIKIELTDMKYFVMLLIRGILLKTYK